MFFLQIKYKSVKKYIEFDDTDLEDHSIFIKKVFDAFQIEQRNDRKIKFLDEDSSTIYPHLLKPLIGQYKNCAHFVLYLIFTDDHEKFDAHIERLKDFILKEEGNEELLHEEKQLKYLTQHSKRRVYEHIFNFLKRNYTIAAKADDIRNVCCAAVNIFTSLKAKNADPDGIDYLYDAKKRSGIIYNKFIYNKRVIKQNDLAIQKASHEDQQASHEEVNCNVEDIMQFFESCILPRDESKLKMKLRETIAMRREKNLNNEGALLNLFLVSPNLIKFDFKAAFPEVIDQALPNAWRSIEKNVITLCSMQKSESLAVYWRNDQIRTLVKLLAIVPTNRKKFEKALQSLLTVTEDPNCDPMRLLQNSESPRMIAVHSNTDNTWKYYIELLNHLISVPSEMDFVSSFDLFYKVHYQFNLLFHADFDQLMVFFDHYVYEICGEYSKPYGKTKSSAREILKDYGHDDL